MSLLGPPSRRPVLQTVYRMRPELYDPTDDVGHPLLVVAVDVVTRTAGVVTRTSTSGAGGRGAVSHPADATLALDRPGWWRIFKVHRVPWAAFNDPDVQVLGRISDTNWKRVQEALLTNGEQQ